MNIIKPPNTPKIVWTPGNGTNVAMRILKNPRTISIDAGLSAITSTISVKPLIISDRLSPQTLRGKQRLNSLNRII